MFRRLIELIRVDLCGVRPNAAVSATEIVRASTELFASAKFRRGRLRGFVSDSISKAWRVFTGRLKQFTQCSNRHRHCGACEPDDVSNVWRW